MAMSIHAKQVTNVLIIGKSGVGKATLANCICDTFIFEDNEKFVQNSTLTTKAKTAFNEQHNTMYNIVVADIPETMHAGDGFFSQIQTLSFDGYFNLIIYLMRSGCCSLREIESITAAINNECTEEFKALFCMVVNMGDTIILHDTEEMKNRLTKEHESISKLVCYASKGLLFVNLPHCNFIDNSSFQVFSPSSLKEEILDENLQEGLTSRRNKQGMQNSFNEVHGFQLVVEETEPTSHDKVKGAQLKKKDLKIEEDTELYLKVLSQMFEKSKTDIRHLLDNCRRQKSALSIFNYNTMYTARRCSIL